MKVCPRVAARVSCDECGYPLSEAREDQRARPDLQHVGPTRILAGDDLDMGGPCVILRLGITKETTMKKILLVVLALLAAATAVAGSQDVTGIRALAGDFSINTAAFQSGWFTGDDSNAGQVDADN
jgi:hypothetical protein